MDSGCWFCIAHGQRQGPLSLEGLVDQLVQLETPQDVLVWREGLGAWVKAENLPEVACKLPPPLPTGAPSPAAKESEVLHSPWPHRSEEDLPKEEVIQLNQLRHNGKAVAEVRSDGHFEIWIQNETGFRIRQLEVAVRPEGGPAIMLDLNSKLGAGLPPGAHGEFLALFPSETWGRSLFWEIESAKGTSETKLPISSPVPATPDGCASSAAEATAEPRHKGVGGWLLFFCLGLTLFTPLITLGLLAESYSSSSKYFGQFPGLLIINVIDTLLSLGLVAFSIYAGVGLWRIRPGAVQLTKRYLWYFLGYHAVTAILPFMAGLPSEANDAMLAEVVKDTFRGGVYFAVWYSYLNKSRRVSATYRS
jgi:hypothetical protein